MQIIPVLDNTKKKDRSCLTFWYTQHPYEYDIAYGLEVAFSSSKWNWITANVRYNRERVTKFK